MPNRRRLSEDAFSWVQKTTEKNEETKPAETRSTKTRSTKTRSTKTRSTKKAASKPRKPRVATEATPGRIIFIEYNKKDGHIIATHEVHQGAGEVTDTSWTIDSEDQASAYVALTGKLSDKELIDIHVNFKVVISKKKPKLVPKG